MPSDARAELQRAQDAVVLALVSGGEKPDGFTAEAIERAARTLLGKRARVAGQQMPRLARSLGPDFEGEFRAWAERHPRRVEAIESDGIAFARHLAACGRLTDAGRVEWLTAQLRHGFLLRIARLPQRRRWILGWRWPRGARVTVLGTPRDGTSARSPARG